MRVQKRKHEEGSETMYKKMDLFRGSGKPEMVVIGYWQPETGPAIVRDFTYIDERGIATSFRNSNVIGRTLEEVVQDQEGCGFSQ